MNASIMSRGTILVMLGTLLFSCKAILVKYLYQYDIGALELQTLRMLMVLPFYLLILGWLILRQGPGQLSFRDIIASVIAGIACYHIASYLDLLGLKYISAGLERIILFCYPAIAVLFGWLFLKEQPHSRLWLALGLSYSGILLFFYADAGFGGDNLVYGSLLVFCASILTAWYMVANQKYSRRMGSQRFTCMAMIGASVSITLHAVLLERVSLSEFAPPLYLGAGVMALFCTLIPSFLISAGVKRIGASQAGIVGTVGPLMTIVLANSLLDEPVTWLHGAGLALVIIGMSRLRQGSRTSAT